MATATETRLREENALLKQQIEQFRESLSQLEEQPMMAMRVFSVYSTDGKRRATFQNGGRIVVVPVPDKDIFGKSLKRLKAGDIVFVSGENMQIASIADIPNTSGGTVVKAKAVFMEGAMIEVEHGGGTTLVNAGTFTGKVEEGDRVVVEGGFIIHNIGKKKDGVGGQFRVPPQNVRWDDIVGQEEAKQYLRESIELPFRFPGVYERYGKKQAKGVLFSGPPGCGKTMLGKATATALAEIHGQEAHEGFLYVKGPEVLSMWVGETERTIRAIFDEARSFKAKHGYPALVFIDEADAILRARGGSAGTMVDRTIVPQFLTEMDGLDTNAAIIILATNRPQDLDPAIVRDGRISRKVRVTRPTHDAAMQMFEIKMRHLPIEESIENLAVNAAKKVFSDELVLLEARLKSGARLPIRMRDIFSGAMADGIVDMATSMAIARDIEDGIEGYICSAMMDEAVERVFAQQRNLSHDETLREAEEVHGAIEAWRLAV